MDCYICDPKTNETGECESCRFDLYPLQEYMREITGDSAFNDHAALSAVDQSDATAIDAWCAGAQIPYAVIRIGGNYQVARIPAPKISFATHAEQRIAEIEAQLAEAREDLETLYAVVGLTPIAGNKDALQEAMNIASKALKGKGGE